MNEIEGGRIERAREATSRGDLRSAFNLLVEADAAAPLACGDLALLAEVAYAIGNLEATLGTWERVHAHAVEAGDRLTAGAAATRIAMHLIMDTGLLAPVRVWVKRANGLLRGLGETPVEAWLAVPRTYERLLSGDFRAARHWARRAIDVGTTCNEPAAAAMGRVAEARCQIFEGEVARGLESLDEAAAATISGEVDPLTVGLIYCELVCAWQGLAQYDRAEELTEAMERWCGGHPALGSVHGRCRVHRAEILRLRGPLDDAEREAMRACEELRPLLRRELGWPLNELGVIRLQKGDLAGAEEAFLAAHEAGWNPQPGLALLHLTLGDVRGAQASIDDAIDNPRSVPSKELPPHTDLREAPLLAAQAEISVESGDLDKAQGAVEKLGRIATVFESKALHANAAFAGGSVHLALGRTAAARDELERAVRLWTELAAPYETARARMSLAEAYRAQGDGGRAGLELRAAGATFERLGACRMAERAASAGGYANRAGAGRSAAKGDDGRGEKAGGADASTGIFRAEGDYWSIAYEGQTVRVSDLKGMHYLARLIAHPGHEFHALDLVSAEHPGPQGVPPDRVPELRSAPGDAGPLLDARAKEAYRRRLSEIEEDIEEAHMLGDIGRAARAEADREFIVRELSRAVGLGGRDRRSGSLSERARVSVTRAVRRALARIREHHPPLGAHLEHALHTGTYCAYRPDPRARMTWKV
jgi:tetratricopeptide (TPR) repeat protein